MSRLKQYLNAASARTLPWIGAGLAAVLAGWLLYCNNGRVNSDGILYMEVARLISDGNWHGALQLYPWPLYPALAAALHHATGLTLHLSAQLLTMLFFPLTVYALLRLILAAGGGRNEMLAGLLLIFSASYLMRDMLSMLVRDHGFWAFHVLSLVFLMQFLSSRRWQNALWWGATGTVATLFRIEGLVFLAALPLVLMLDNSQPMACRIRHLFRCNLFLILAGIGLGLALIVHPDIKLSQLGRLGDPLIFVSAAVDNIVHGLHVRADQMAEVVLSKFLDDYALLGIMLTLIAVLVGKTAGVMGWIPTLLAGVALAQPDRTPLIPHARRLLLGWLAVSLAICMLVLIAQFLLPARYAMPGGFALTILGAFGLARLYRDRKSRSSRTARYGWVLPALLLVLCVKLLYVVGVHDSRENYEKDAVAWTLAHATPQSRIFYDDAKLRFYAGLPFTDRETGWTHLQVRGESLDRYDFAVVRVSRHKPEFLDELLKQYPLRPLQEFKDTAGNKIVILGRPDGTGNSPIPPR